MDFLAELSIDWYELGEQMSKQADNLSLELVIEGMFASVSSDRRKELIKTLEKAIAVEKPAMFGAKLPFE